MRVQSRPHASTVLRLIFAGALFTSILAIRIENSPAAHSGPISTSSASNPSSAVGAAGGGLGGGWSVTGSGAVTAFGTALSLGGLSGRSLSKPVVGMASTPDGRGYWLVASDGGIFAFGDAVFYGSTGGITLNRPVVGMASAPDGRGYWLVASDGGIFSFGDAVFLGSAASKAGYQAVSVVPAASGYYLVSSDGMWSSFGATSASPSGVSSTTIAATSPPPTTSSQQCCSAAQFTGDNAVTPRVVGTSLLDIAGKPVRLLGFNIPGTENACIENKGFSWGPFNSTEAESIASWHANAVRVPLNEDCWLGINGAPSQYSGAPYRQAIENWVADLNDAGVVVILDLLSVAPGTYQAKAQWPMADADHSVTLWSQVASAFANDPSVIFDLYNEPFIGRSNPTSSDWSCWLNGCSTSFALCPFDESTGEFQVMSGCPIVNYQTAGMQELVDAVRAAGAAQPIMVGGLNWAGDPCGLYDSGADRNGCMWLADEPVDPDHQLAVSFHTYDWTACTTSSCWNADVGTVAAHAPVITGEFGEADCSTGYIDAFMNWADQHKVSYLAQSWQPSDSANPSPCVPGAHTGPNFWLLSNWSGAPSTIVPQGAAVNGHLAGLAASGS